jgi:hypothetical protein
MRNAKINASEALDRRSNGVMVVSRTEGADKAVTLKHVKRQ